jgi:hypothetical protein
MIKEDKKMGIKRVFIVGLLQRGVEEAVEGEELRKIIRRGAFSTFGCNRLCKLNFITISIS